MCAYAFDMDLGGSLTQGDKFGSDSSPAYVTRLSPISQLIPFQGIPPLTWALPPEGAVSHSHSPFKSLKSHVEEELALCSLPINTYDRRRNLSVLHPFPSWPTLPKHGPCVSIPRLFDDPDKPFWYLRLKNLKKNH